MESPLAAHIAKRARFEERVGRDPLQADENKETSVSFFPEAVYLPAPTSGFSGVPLASSSGEASPVSEVLSQGPQKRLTNVPRYQDRPGGKSIISAMKHIMFAYGDMRHTKEHRADGTSNNFYNIDAIKFALPSDAWAYFCEKISNIATFFHPEEDTAHTCANPKCNKVIKPSSKWVMCTKSLECRSRFHLKCVNLPGHPKQPWTCPNSHQEMVLVKDNHSSGDCTSSGIQWNGDAPAPPRLLLAPPGIDLNRESVDPAIVSDMEKYGWVCARRDGVWSFTTPLKARYTSFEEACHIHMNAKARFLRSRRWETNNGGRMWYSKDDSTRKENEVDDALEMEGAVAVDIFPEPAEVAMLPDDVPECPDEDEVKREVPEGWEADLKQRLEFVTNSRAKKVIRRIINGKGAAEFCTSVMGVPELIRLVERLCDLLANERGPTHKLLAGGLTQSQKTVFLIIGGFVGCEFGIFVIVITCTNDNRDELVNDKMHPRYRDWGFGEDDAMNYIPCITFEDAVKLKSGQFWQQKGVVVLAATAHQINTLMRLFSELFSEGYMVLLDEADAMYDGGKTARYKALKWLVSNRGGEDANSELNGPRVMMSITATLVPCMVKSVIDGEQLGRDDVFYTRAHEDYVSVYDFKPLVVEGKELFIDPEECDNFSLFAYGKKHHIFLDAMRGDRKDALVVDITCPRVSQGNHKVKKEVNTMDHIVEKVVKDFKNVVGLVVNGDGERMYIPGENGVHEWVTQPKPAVNCKGGRYGEKKRGLAPMIEDAMKVVNERWGGEGFVYVVGYHLLLRGISIRASMHACTHIICVLTRGISLCESLQAFGRATGMQKELLRGKGYGHVTILTTRIDLEAVVAYCEFMKYVNGELGKGKKLNEIISERSSYPWQCCFSNAQKCLSGQVGPKQANLVLPGYFEQRPEPAQAVVVREDGLSEVRDVIFVHKGKASYVGIWPGPDVPPLGIWPGADVGPSSISDNVHVLTEVQQHLLDTHGDDDELWKQISQRDSLTKSEQTNMSKRVASIFGKKRGHCWNSNNNGEFSQCPLLRAPNRRPDIVWSSVDRTIYAIVCNYTFPDSDTFSNVNTYWHCFTQVPGEIQLKRMVLSRR